MTLYCTTIVLECDKRDVGFIGKARLETRRPAIRLNKKTNRGPRESNERASVIKQRSERLPCTPNTWTISMKHFDASTEGVNGWAYLAALIRLRGTHL